MHNEGVHLDGVMSAVLTKPDGTQTKIEKHNLIVQSGIDFMCDAMGKSSSRPAIMNHIGIGTGSTAPADNQTTLVTQTLRKPATYAHTTGTGSFTLTSTFEAGEATGALKEAGVFNAISAGKMLDRVVFPVINKEPNDILTMTFTFTVSPAA